MGIQVPPLERGSGAHGCHSPAHRQPFPMGSWGCVPTAREETLLSAQATSTDVSWAGLIPLLALAAPAILDSVLLAWPVVMGRASGKAAGRPSGPMWPWQMEAWDGWWGEWFKSEVTVALGMGGGDGSGAMMTGLAPSPPFSSHQRRFQTLPWDGAVL